MPSRSPLDLATAVARRVRRRVAGGAPVVRTTLGELEASGFAGVRPVWALSTGRAGTRLVSDLLEEAGAALVLHSARPELIRTSRLAYERIERPGELDGFVEIVRACRDEYVLDAVRAGRQLVETNCRLTFLAPALAVAYPGSSFVHIVRHPAEIVTSGARRGWWSGSHDHDVGRIVPLAGSPEAERWASSGFVERVGFLWRETARFVERFAAGSGAGRVSLVQAERLFADAHVAAAVMAACRIDPLPEERIARVIARPSNAQRGGSFPKWREWSAEQRAALVEVVGEAAAAYGYDLEDGSTTRPKWAPRVPDQALLAPA